MEKFNFDNFSEKEKAVIIMKASDERKQKDFYEKLRQRVDDYIKEHPKAKHINYIMMFPDLFHLTCKLFVDERVPAKNKVFLGCAIVYCISPLDIIPDIIPGGFTDDALLIIKTLSDLISSVDNKIICDHWTGEESIIKVIKKLSAVASEWLNKEKIANKISAFVDSLKNK